ncbi:hypothetical protein L3X38_039030 [Prunus dulcis]|uniref:Fungal lipase-type domain-containing protein n=1 Tax=Prunus dulcis TaxID=3755 RepID=A0AAD4V8H9_PRUDU|nr:hypothetical protein L3X38_039030 [Prunus dulcis]
MDQRKWLLKEAKRKWLLKEAKGSGFSKKPKVSVFSKKPKEVASQRSQRKWLLKEAKEEVGFFDLIHILFSTTKFKEGNKFLDMSKFVSKPLSELGSGIEVALNLIPSNRNVFVLVLNFLRGRAVKPDKTSATFLSFIGIIGKRVELDSSIKHDDANYRAALSAMASKASYENSACIETIVKNHWKMEFLGFYDFWNDYQGKATTQAFLLRDKTCDQDTNVLAFRGTEPFDADAWCSDFDFSWYELYGVGKIHGGFMKALGLHKNDGWPKEEVKQDVILAMHDEAWLLERLQGVHTFGQPRVGYEKFGEFMEKQLKEHRVPYFRIVYGNDMVPRLPFDDNALMYKHFGTCLYYNRHYEVKVVEEEPYRNYFSPLGAMSKMINAFWELIRSFTISYTKGSGYKEGWL